MIEVRVLAALASICELGVGYLDHANKQEDAHDRHGYWRRFHPRPGASSRSVAAAHAGRRLQTLVTLTANNCTDVKSALAQTWTEGASKESRIFTVRTGVKFWNDDLLTVVHIRFFQQE